MHRNHTFVVAARQKYPKSPTELQAIFHGEKSASPFLHLAGQISAQDRCDRASSSFCFHGSRFPADTLNGQDMTKTSTDSNFLSLLYSLSSNYQEITSPVEGSLPK
jgi:hypothetical protein